MNHFSINNAVLKKLPHFLFYIAIALLAISDSGIQLFILFTVGPGSRNLRLLAMWLLLIKIILTKYTKKEFFILAPITFLALYNYTVSGNIICVYTILVIAAMKNINYTYLFRTLFYSTLAAIIFVGLFSFWDIGSPLKLTEDFGRGLIETRFCFGLHHPNIWHQAMGRCIVFACIGYYKQINIFHLITLLIFNYFVYTMSVSRTGLIATSIFLILIILYKYLEKIMHSLLIKICAFSCMISVYGTYIYFTCKLTGEYHLRAEEFNWLVANGRLRQAVDFLSLNPARLFGSRFPDDGTLFDCGFFRLFYECGYLWTGLFFIALLALILLALRRNWDPIIPTCVYFIFYSLYEFNPVTRPTYNVVVFFLSLLLFKSTFFQKPPADNPSQHL